MALNMSHSKVGIVHNLHRAVQPDGGVLEF